MDQLSMSMLNSMAMQVQAEQVAIAESHGYDTTLLRSEHWLAQLLSETAVELQAKGVRITYD